MTNTQDPQSESKRRRRGSRRSRGKKRPPQPEQQQHALKRPAEVRPQQQPRPPQQQGEKRYQSLDDFYARDEIQQLPNSTKISKLADNRNKSEDQVVISTNIEMNGFTYFFDVHDLADGERYLSIMQSKATNSGDFQRQQIRIKRTELPQFLDELRKVLGFFLV